MTNARVERWKRGLSLQAVSTLTTIPVNTLSDIERGEKIPNDADLQALAVMYGYVEPAALLREAVFLSESEVRRGMTS